MLNEQAVNMQTIAPSESDPLTSSQDKELNITEIAYVYLDNVTASKDASNIQLELTSAIEKIESESIENQSNKSKSLVKALNKIKKYDSSLESKKLIASDIESYKNDIKETLAVYKDYFSIKFSADGDPENCDPEIKKILTNFDDNGLLFTSIKSSDDMNGLKLLRYELSGYLAALTILAESSTNNNPSDPNYDPDKQAKNIDAIKATLSSFPSDGTNIAKSDHNCVQGSRQRIQDAIFKSKKLSQETKIAKGYIDIFATQLAQVVEEEKQIHIPSSLLGSLLIDRAIVAQIDNFYTTPQSDIPLNKIIEFSHNFAKKTKADLLEPKIGLTERYAELLSQTKKKKDPKDETKFITVNKITTFHDINVFVAIAKSYGFDFEAIDLFKNKAMEYEKSIASQLIPLEQLQKEYLQIPSAKFKEELSKIKDKALPAIDYVQHLPDPQDLFKIHKSESSESPTIKTLSNRLDVNKIGNLVNLLTETPIDITTEPQDALTKKSKITAGLITLRSILDGYETSDNVFLYFLKFDAKFKERTGTNFVDFFYENSPEGPKIKAEFSEEESIIETIRIRASNQERLFFGTVAPNSDDQLRNFINNLLLIENFESEENKNKLRELLTENNLALKNNSQENLLTILYQFDEDAFKIALEHKPELIQTIAEKDIEGLSLINKLASKDLTQIENKELFWDVLERYKANSINLEDPNADTEALIKIINSEGLLFDIIKKNNIEALNEIIKKATYEDSSLIGNAVKIDFDKKDYDDCTILHLACFKGFKEIVETLLTKEVSIEAKTLDGKTPLHLACENGHAKVVEALLKKDPNTKAKTLDGKTPIHLACKNGYIEVVKALLATNDTSIDEEVDKTKLTPLHLACEKGYTELVKFLLENGAKREVKTSNEENILHLASKNGHLEVVKVLLADDALKNALINEGTVGDFTPLHYASSGGNAEVVKALLEKGANIEAKTFLNQRTCLYYACDNGHKKVVEALLEKKPDLVNQAEVGDETPLYIACRKGHAEIVKILLEKGALINQVINDEETPLYIACIKDHAEIVKILLEKGALLNQPKTKSPLCAACIYGHLEVIKDLVTKFDGSINELDQYGQTPLLHACHKGNLDIIKALLQLGADPNKGQLDESTDFHKTPLHFFCSYGHIKVVKILLENEKTDINKPFKDGKTPLHFACEKGRIEVVKALIEKGALINQVDNAGFTPLDYAFKEGHTKVVEALFEGGAFVSSLKLDQPSATPEMEALIKIITDPKEIEIRDQNLRQIAFNKENDKLFDSISNHSRDTSQTALTSQNQDLSPINISEITLVATDSSLQTTHNEVIDKEISNCLLFLKFVALEISSEKESAPTKDQKISKMLAIYKNNNDDTSFISPFIEDVVANKDNLQTILKSISAEELIKLSRRIELETSSAEPQETSIQVKIEKIISQSLTKKTTASPIILDFSITNLGSKDRNPDPTSNAR